MSDQPDTSLLARLLGQNWRTTIGGTLSAAGGVLATQTTGKRQIAGGIMLAIGLQWMGATARDKVVTSAQMDAAGAGQSIPNMPNPPPPPPKLSSSLLVLGLLACLLAGCMAPVTVNVFSSRMVTTYGTNAVSQSIEGGANLSSNVTTATAPLK